MKKGQAKSECRVGVGIGKGKVFCVFSSCVGSENGYLKAPPSPVKCGLLVVDPDEISLQK